MGIWPLIVLTVGYFIVAFTFYELRQYPMVIVWIFYGCANFGFIWQALQGAK